MSTRLGPDQFIELQLDRGAIPVLGVLEEEHHQEGHNRRPGVDHQLPGIAEAERWAGERPAQDDQHGEDEGQRMAHRPGRLLGKASEPRPMIHGGSFLLGSPLARRPFTRLRWLMLIYGHTPALWDIFDRSEWPDDLGPGGL